MATSTRFTAMVPPAISPDSVVCSTSAAAIAMMTTAVLHFGSSARAPVGGTITTSTSSRLEKSTPGLTVIAR
jgi:hypothetical protein